MPPRKTRKDYPPAFEAIWGLYPYRRDNPKPLAYSAWNARIDEGVNPDDLLAAVQGYEAELRRAGKLGTEYVLMAKTFFGCNDRWQAFLPKESPAAAAKPKNSSPEERIDGRPFLREIIEKLSGGLRQIP